MNKITAFLVVHNEENYIRDALLSIAEVVDEIVVVHDGPCADGTLDIAKEFAANIISLPQQAGSAEFVRPIGLEHCTGDWVFVLDADERLSPALRDSLRTLTSDPAADSYGFAWPYVTKDGEPVGRVSVSGKRFLFRRSKMYTIGLPHMTPDTFGTNISRSDLEVYHVLKQPDVVHQIRRLRIRNRERGRIAATILAGGVTAVRTFNADLSDVRVKNIRKINLFVDHPLLALITVPAFSFLHQYFIRGYFKAGLIGLHDALNIPLFQAWTCLYRIRDGITGRRSA